MKHVNHVTRDENGNFDVRPMFGQTPRNAIGVLPPSILPEDWPFVTGEEATVNQVTSWQFSVDQVAKAAATSEQDKKDQVQAAYGTMNTAIYDKLFEIFRTRKPESATAEHETWKDMLANPADYSGLGLKIDYLLMASDGTTELFSAGSALDTDQKITDFATRKLEQVREYGPFRAQKKQEYYTAKDAIENP